MSEIGESGEAIASAEDARLNRRSRRVRHRRRKRIALWTVAALVLLTTAGALTWGALGDDVRKVTVAGATFETNLRLAEHHGDVYVYVPVNATVRDLVLSTGEKVDDAKIREFLDQLDTVRPGEHTLEVDGEKLHVIVDGIDE